MSYIKRVNFNILNFEKHGIGEDTNINKCVYMDRNLMLNLENILIYFRCPVEKGKKAWQ